MPMREFLIEFYIARKDVAAVGNATQRARHAAEQLAGEGTPVRCLSSIFIAEEETCFLLYEAPSAGAVQAAAGRAGLPSDHITEVIAP